MEWNFKHEHHLTTLENIYKGASARMISLQELRKESYQSPLFFKLFYSTQNKLDRAEFQDIIKDVSMGYYLNSKISYGNYLNPWH
jgi:hypothetical protein